MLNALTKRVVNYLKDIGIDEVYAIMHDEEEIVNLKKRGLTEEVLADERKAFYIFSKPIGFVRLMDIRYDDRRSGYRIFNSGFKYLPAYGKYFSLRMASTTVSYELKVYCLSAAQSLSIVPFLVHAGRIAPVEVRINDNFVLQVPVSLLFEEVYESTVEFMLRNKGLKVYKVGGRLSALTYMFPDDVPGLRGEQSLLRVWDDISKYLTPPLMELRLNYYLGEKNVSGDVFRYSVR